MKTAIYIEGNVVQVILTPQGEEEKRVLAMLRQPGKRLTVLTGEFYECRGGWYRQGMGEESTILRVDEYVEPAKDALSHEVAS